MSTATPEQPVETSLEDGDVHPEGEHDAHPADWVYIRVGILLAIVTALEVFTYFESVHQLSDNAIIAVLLIMMVIKFFYVTGYFMHLKFDSPIFRQAFVFGLGLAYAVYTIMLLAFNFWF